MLQIITGKFFDDAGRPLNEREENAVLYSNFSWIQPVRTCAVELRPVDYATNSLATYVLRYTLRYQPKEQDVLVHPASWPVVDQFRALAVIWFKAFFHNDRSYVETLCRASTRNTSNEIVPSRFAPSFFDAQRRGTAEEVQNFPAFVDKVIAMPRTTFKSFMTSLGIFVDALEALNVNFDLAYSMFVYLLEALGTASRSYVPTWPDYDQNVRIKLDGVLSSLAPPTAADIRSVLLDGAQLKLTKRFKSFVIEHVEDAFFKEEATGIARALPRTDLDHALGNLYKTRSGFVHELRAVHEQLRLPHFGNADIFTWNNETFLTMAGLVRLTRHVLMTFAKRAESISKEDYPWRSELPGIIMAQMAPKYWIWRTEGFDGKQSAKKLSGIIEHIVSQYGTSEMGLPDLRPLMVEIEKLIGQATETDRITLLAIYFLYNRLIEEGYRQPDWDIFLSKNGFTSLRCHIALIASELVADFLPFRWPVDDCVAAYEEYQRTKYRDHAVHLPVRLEAAIAVEIANLYLSLNDHIAFKKWVSLAISDLAGLSDLQQSLEVALNEKAPIDSNTILGR